MFARQLKNTRYRDMDGALYSVYMPKGAVSPYRIITKDSAHAHNLSITYGCSICEIFFHSSISVVFLNNF